MLNWSKGGSSEARRLGFHGDVFVFVSGPVELWAPVTDECTTPAEAFGDLARRPEYSPHFAPVSERSVRLFQAGQGY